MIGSRVSSRQGWIIEIPQTRQAVLQTGQPLELVLTNLQLGPLRDPHPDFVHRALEVIEPSRRRRATSPIVPAQIIVVAIFDGNETAWESIGGDEQPVEIDSNAAFAGHDREVAPAIALNYTRGGDIALRFSFGVP